MRKQQVKVVIGVLITAILGLVGWQMLKLREPVYQGKPLTVWLAQYGTNHWTNRGGELDKEAETAIRRIGTNSIPRYRSDAPNTLRIIEAATQTGVK